MSVERDLNRRICAALSGFHPVRIENAVSQGVPDINFRDGWIEDKCVDFPKRESSIVRVPHYTPRQRAWHIARRATGGHVWVALEKRQTGELFVFDAADAARHLGNDWTEEYMHSHIITRKHKRGIRPFYLATWDARSFRQHLLVSV